VADFLGFFHVLQEDKYEEELLLIECKILEQQLATWVLSGSPLL